MSIRSPYLASIVVPILTLLCGATVLAQGNDAPAHGRPFFMPAQERTRIRLHAYPFSPTDSAEDPKMLTPVQLMVLSRWVDSNHQFYGSFLGRRHAQWIKADPKNPAYDPADFRRKATFDEATSLLAPEWHR